MQLTKTQASAMLTALGYPSANTWDVKRLTDKIKKLSKVVSDQGQLADTIPADVKVNITASLEALKSGVGVTVLDDTPAPAAGAAPAPKVKKEKAPAVKKEPIVRIYRASSIAIVINGLTSPTKLADVVTTADADVVKKGGKSNPRETTYQSNIVIQAFTAIGLIEVKDGVITKK